MISGMEVKFKQKLMPLKFQMSTAPGSMNFDVYMPKIGVLGRFFGDVES